MVKNIMQILGYNENDDDCRSSDNFDHYDYYQARARRQTRQLIDSTGNVE